MPSPYTELYELDNKANKYTPWTPSNKIKKLLMDLSLVFVLSELTDAIEIKKRIESRLMEYLKLKFDKTKLVTASIIAILSIILNIFQYFNKVPCP